MDLTHFADSILAARDIVLKNENNINKIFDIGSGNGFPGVVLAICNPNIHVLLIDSDQRKIEFLKNVKSAIGLSNLEVICTQVEALPDNSIDYAIMRGFASITKSLLVMRNKVKRNGVIFHLKGEGWTTELSDIPAQLCKIWQPSLLSSYSLPQGTSRFYVVSTKKSL